MSFNYFFKEKHPRLLGLDVTSSAVKLIELSQSGDCYQVETFGILPLPNDAIVENQIHNFDAVSKVVEQLIRLTKPSTRSAAIAVSGASVITKVIQLDSTLTEMEMESQILLQEAPRFIPFPIQEVSLDFEVLGINSVNPNLVDVLIAASRTESVMQRVNAIEAGGLNVKVVDVESYVMERAYQLTCANLPFLSDCKTVALIDVGSLLTKITVLNNQETVFYREEIFGSAQLTDAIQQRYGLSFSEAGLAKKRGDLGEDYETKVLNPFRQSLVPLVRRSLQFFFSAHRVQKVDYLLLAGGGALTTGLEQMLKEQIGIPTAIVNPFANMLSSHRCDVEHLTANAPTLMSACGLALRSFVDGKH